MSKDRKTYATTLNTDLIKRLKILAAEEETKVNNLLEEAIRDLLKKHGKPAGK